MSTPGEGPETTTGPESLTGRPRFEAADDGFHFAVMSGAWWETETAWFSFHHPERRMGGWLYTMVRPNIGTVAGGAWVWDDSAWLPWEVLYSANYSALPLPAGVDLRDVTLPTGVSIRVVEPTRSYDLGFRDRDPDRLTVDIRFRAVMPPEPLVAVGSTFGSSHHFDQLGRVTGTVTVLGEQLDVDCLAMRDRTWGHRPEDRPRQAAYVTGAAADDQAFLAVTGAGDEDSPVAYGFLRRRGRTTSLTHGWRHVERDPEHGWVARIIIEARDTDGRTLRAVGQPVSRMVVNRHTFIDINSLIHWDLGGAPGWGEDQDMWPVHHFAAWRRNQGTIVRRPSHDERSEKGSR
jgi:hypothetical protein